MIKIVFKSYNSDVLNFYKGYFSKLAVSKNKVFNVISLPNLKEKITLLKSPHVHKKFKEHYFRKTHILVIKTNLSKVEVKSLLSSFSINRNGVAVYFQ